MNISVPPQDAKSIDRHIGRRIREERVKRGMSQGELAQRIGITYQQAHKYENGVNRTAASRLLLIANALGVEVGDLLPTNGAVSPMEPIGRLELELARNFARITSERHRQSICQLIRSLANG